MKKLLASITVATSLISFNASALLQPEQPLSASSSDKSICRTTSVGTLETANPISVLSKSASTPVLSKLQEASAISVKVGESLQKIGDTATTAKVITDNVTHHVHSATQAILEHVSALEDNAGLQKRCSSCLGTSVDIIDKIGNGLSRFFSFLSTIGRSANSGTANA